MLLGRRVKVKSGAALGSAQVRAAATYVCASGEISFVTLADIPFVASVGAALALIPVSAVNEAIKTGKPSPLLVENAHEVLNVAASLFNELDQGASPPVHVKLERLDVGPLDARLSARLLKPAARVDLDVSVAGYPDGKLSFLALSGA